MATMADELNFNFSLIRVNLHLQLHRHMWLMATMLGSTALGVAQSAGNYYYLTQVLPLMAGISWGAKRVVRGEWRKTPLSLYNTLLSGSQKVLFPPFLPPFPPSLLSFFLSFSPSFL